MQSSGFLDLKSLMTLSQTCKSNAYDTQSLILLIENEISGEYHIETVEEVIACWREVCGDPLLKQWLERESCSLSSDGASVSSIIGVQHVQAAAGYHVMLAKMLRTIPQAQRLQTVSSPDIVGMNVLHSAARLGSLESLKVILSSLPDHAQRLQLVNMRDHSERTVLHCAADSGNSKSVK